MRIDMKRLVTFAALLGVVASLHAEMSMDARVRDLEHRVMANGAMNMMDTYGAQLALGRPTTENRTNINFQVLYWHPKVQGTAYAISQNTVEGNYPFTGQAKAIDFNWNWGFRVGFGYGFIHDGWDGNVEYTYQRFSSDNDVNPGANSSISPIRSNPKIISNTPTTGAFNFAAYAKSSYTLKYSTLVLDLSKMMFASRFFAVTPRFGVMAAWIDHDQSTQYVGGTATPVDTNNGRGAGANNNVRVSEVCKTSGIGPRIGADTSWYFSHNWNLFANPAFSYLFTHYQTSNDQRWSADSSRHQRTSLDLHNFVPTASLSLGIALGGYVNNNTQYLKGSLSYDAQYFWGSRMNSGVSTARANILGSENYRNLSLYGITFKFLWAF